jgi:DNA-binding transcriptional MerR regulator
VATAGGRTIGELARAAGVSRSALLFYDRRGIVRPSRRSAAGYRLYDAADEARLAQVRLYREMGFSLDEIARVMAEAPGGAGAGAVLRRRLQTIGREIARLREHQRRILRLLAQDDLTKEEPMLNKEQFVAVLRAAGLTDDEMDAFHVQFERMEPESHQEFLELLGIPAEEVAAIRAHARAGASE